MKKRFIVILFSLLMGITIGFSGCAKDTSRVESIDLQPYVNEITSYFKKFDSDYSISKNIDEQSLRSQVKQKLTLIDNDFAPKYEADAASIESYVYGESNPYRGCLRFNNYLSVVMGGRANYIAGQIIKENEPAVYTFEEIQKVLQIEDEALKTEMLNVTNVSQIFRSIVVSFNNDKRFVMTTHYTELGVRYVNSLGGNVKLNQEYYVMGTYSVSLDAINGTNEYSLNVVLNDGKQLDFVFNSATKTVYQKNNIFSRIPMIADNDSMSNANLECGYGNTEFNVGTEKYIDITYGDKTMQADPSKQETDDVLNDRQKLDIYIPSTFDKNKAGGNGIIMIIHGGSWQSGAKEDMEEFCAYYTNLGYITAAMNHTYIGRKYNDGTVVTFLDIEKEIDAAFRKIKELSDKNGWNITKAATCGYSSGSHLATWYAYGKGNEPDAPIPVVLTFSMVGPMSFYDDCWVDIEGIFKGKFIAALGLNDPSILTMEGEELNAELDRISPLSYVKKGDAVPTVLCEAMLDTTLISGENGIQMEKALTEKNIDHDVIMFPNSDHATAANAECGNVFRMKTENFLKKYFGY